MPADFLEILPVGVWVLDEDLRVTAVNSRIQEFFGMPCAQFVGQDKRKLVTEQIYTIFENGDEFLRRILATYNQNTYAENFLVHVLPGEDRQERWLEHFSQPIKRDGAIVGRVEIYFDVTERIQFEQELNWISTQFIKVQEREKANIASNLHNQVGQSVIALKLALERLQTSLRETGNPEHTEQMNVIVSQVEGIARDISQISNDLLPPEHSAFRKR
jgi:PAS domain S-box-containing protein